MPPCASAASTAAVAAGRRDPTHATYATAPPCIHTGDSSSTGSAAVSVLASRVPAPVNTAAVAARVDASKVRADMLGADIRNLEHLLKHTVV